MRVLVKVAKVKFSHQLKIQKYDSVKIINIIFLKEISKNPASRADERQPCDTAWHHHRTGEDSSTFQHLLIPTVAGEEILRADHRDVLGVARGNFWSGNCNPQVYLVTFFTPRLKNTLESK